MADNRAYPIYCAYCAEECDEDEDDPYMYGSGGEPYCSEACAEEDGAIG